MRHTAVTATAVTATATATAAIAAAVTATTATCGSVRQGVQQITSNTVHCQRRTSNDNDTVLQKACAKLWFAAALAEQAVVYHKGTEQHPIRYKQC
jgi:hypothetical protein